jgi:hypothetical protein
MKALATALLGFCFVASAMADQTNDLAKGLEPLRPFLKTWKGHFKNSTPEKPNFDVQKWERALNGRALRILHSVNNGSYGGETIIFPNPKSSTLEFHYFTTAGFSTRGTIDFDGNKVITNEEVSRNDDGITKVKGTTELLADGKMRVLTQYFKNGAWTDGRDMTYQESPAAEVLFR